MSLRNPWNSYRQVATQTASPGQLVLMLFDGAIRFLQQAETGFVKEDPAEANETIHNNITRAQEILTELNLSLNLDAGGEFASCMRRLYSYMDERLHEANVTKTPEGVEDVLKRLHTLREAWSLMLQGQTATADQPSPTLIAA